MLMVVVPLLTSWRILCSLLNTIYDCGKDKIRRSGCSKQLSPHAGQKIERNMCNSSHINLNMT